MEEYFQECRLIYVYVFYKKLLYRRNYLPTVSKACNRLYRKRIVNF